MEHFDAVVIGAGLYGCEIAHLLKSEMKLSKVALLEQEGEIVERASFWNQARVHGGYHYPRDFRTAERSQANSARFRSEYAHCISTSLTSLYAIPKARTSVTAKNFVARMHRAGAPLEIASKDQWSLFSRDLIEDVFQVDEQVFDARMMRLALKKKLSAAGVSVLLNHRVSKITRTTSGAIVDASHYGEGTPLKASYVFNCSYSNIANLIPDSPLGFDLQHERATLWLLDIPERLLGYGITVMDGPFFSLLPFPPNVTYSLSHVRYTPQEAWMQRSGEMIRLEAMTTNGNGRWRRAIKDASRFVPALAGSSLRGSFSEIKTVLADNDDNDGRPIAFVAHGGDGKVFSVLGAKIDNVFDVLDHVRKLGLTSR